MRFQTFLYPWDVIGDPAAPERIADLGVDGVTLASAYHSTRALTPRHPRHRIVTAEHSAVYYPPDPALWSGRSLRPYRHGDWVDGDDPFDAAASALSDAGLDVHSWVVLAHNSRLGAEHPTSTVRNAYGDRYPWAPCIARPEVVEYLVDLAAEAAVRPGATGTELESCGWYGLPHLHAHDKIGGVPLDGAAEYLMSLCFCDICEPSYGEPELAARVRTALAPVWAGEWSASGEDAWTDVQRLLGSEAAELTLRHRIGVARALQYAAVAAVRSAAGPGFRIHLHADPLPWRTGANAGVEASWLLARDGGAADGLVVPCTGGFDALESLARQSRDGASLIANFTVVRGMGGDSAGLARACVAACSAGADEIRLYHAGLAGGSDLCGIAEACGGRASVDSRRRCGDAHPVK